MAGSVIQYGGSSRDLTAGLRVTFREAKDNFFDRELVQRAVGEESARALGRVGGYLRTTARRLIRPSRRMKVSEMSPEMAEWYKANPEYERPFASSLPGEPPRARTRKLRNSIFYAFDGQRGSVVAGPIEFSGSRSDHAPSVLEYGGESTVTITQPKKKIKKRGARKTSEKQKEAFKKGLASGRIKREKAPTTTIQVPVTIKPRPYMEPALNIVRPRIVGEFGNLIR